MYSCNPGLQPVILWYIYGCCYRKPKRQENPLFFLRLCLRRLETFFLRHRSFRGNHIFPEDEDSQSGFVKAPYVNVRIMLHLPRILPSTSEQQCRNCASPSAEGWPEMDTNFPWGAGSASPGVNEQGRD